jgi:uncharacterized membrane protein
VAVAVGAAFLPVVAVAVFPVAAAALAAAAREGAGNMKHRDFLNQLAHDDIVAAIRAAEQKTSGEIRVFVSRKKITDPVAAAQAQFERLGMTQTRNRNGVLIYVAPVARKFAILGDQGVHQKCGDEFWRSVAAGMSGHFAQSDFTAGIILGIQKAGELLAAHFPAQPGDTNELPDKVEED